MLGLLYECEIFVNLQLKLYLLEMELQVGQWCSNDAAGCRMFMDLCNRNYLPHFTMRHR